MFLEILCLGINHMSVGDRFFFSIFFSDNQKFVIEEVHKLLKLTNKFRWNTWLMELWLKIGSMWADHIYMVLDYGFHCKSQPVMKCTCASPSVISLSLIHGHSYRACDFLKMRMPISKAKISSVRLRSSKPKLGAVNTETYNFRRIIERR